MNFKGILTAIMILALGLGLSSCKKDSNGNPIPIGSMSATINEISTDDGTTVTGSANWTAFPPLANITAGKLTIGGTSLNFDAIAITVNGVVPGTYKLSLQDLAGQCGCVLSTKYNLQDVLFASSSGEVILTKVDTDLKLVSGTFNFSMYSAGVTKTITSGKFENVSYIQK